MNALVSLKFVFVQILASAAVLAYGALMPVAASAAIQSGSSTGTLVGAVTCGPAEETPAAHAAVAVEGLDVLTHTDAAGRFTLVGVPAAQTLTVDALIGPTVTTRYNVKVDAGQTLDIGSLDLVICPQPTPAAPADDQPSGDFQQDPN